MCVCVDMQQRGGFGASCSFVVAISARLGLLRVFIAAAEQPALCSAAGVDRTFSTGSTGLLGVSGPRIRSIRIAFLGTVHLCVQMAGCDHYSPVLGLTLNKDRYQ